MQPLTRRQREILDFLNDFIQRNGYAPSLEEIGQRFGLSSLATVHKHLTNLEEKGFIKRSWNRSRSVELVPTRLGGRAVELPLLGYVAAGSPIKQDTRARLSITGVTGTAIIQLLGGTPESPPLRTRPDQPAVIVADPSPIAKLMSGGEDLITSITRLLDQANRMFSEANITRFGQIVVNIEQATGNLADQSGGLDQAMTRLNASLNHASGVLRSLDGLLDQEGRQILRQALATMNSLQRSSREVENLLVDNRDSLESGMQGLAGLGPMLQDLGESLDSLRTFSRRLEQNPAGYLLQRDTLEEFRP